MPDSRSRARQGLGPVASAAMDLTGRAVGSAFAAASAVRGAKSLHPRGLVFEATLTTEGSPAAPTGSFLRARSEHPAIVRFSRSLGLPEPMPDLLGISLRLPEIHGAERHQDFLLVTSADLPVAHHVFLPAGDVQQRPYSSSLPYRAGTTRFLVGALPREDSPRVNGRRVLDRARGAAATGRLSFDLAVAPLMGRFRPIGRLRVGPELDPALDAMPFSPWNTGGGVAPTGDFFNRLRGYAYPMSQDGWNDNRRSKEING